MESRKTAGRMFISNLSPGITRIAIRNLKLHERRGRSPFSFFFSLLSRELLLLLLLIERIPRIIWKKNGTSCCFQNQILAHNTSARIIWSNQSLVLQSVTRSSAGKYVCAATNDLNETRSEPLHFRVKCEYFPHPSLPTASQLVTETHLKPIHLGAALYFNRADLIEDFSRKLAFRAFSSSPPPSCFMKAKFLSHSFYSSEYFNLVSALNFS